MYWPLRELALRYLTIPASSYPCEGMFSAAGRLVDEQRSRLFDSRIDELLFLYNNRSYLLSLSIDDLTTDLVDIDDGDDE
jgi:hypothetical protein